MTANPDLYSHLDIPRDADAAAVRRAYRKRAKRDHPDAGGSRDSFALTRLAHDILSDASRRAKYDSTGDTSETSPLNAHAEAVGCIVELFNITLANCAKAARDPLHLNIAREIEKLAAASLVEIEKQRAQLRAGRAHNERFLGRFKLRGAKAKSTANLLDQIMRSRLKPFDDQISQLDAKELIFKAAITMIADYDFTADTPPPQRTENLQFAQFFINVNG